MKRATVYFEPDNMLSTRINGDIESISNFYSMGSVMMLGYSPEHEDGEPYRIKGLEIYNSNNEMIYQVGDCTSKYK